MLSESVGAQFHLADGRIESVAVPIHALSSFASRVLTRTVPIKESAE